MVVRLALLLSIALCLFGGTPDVLEHVLPGVVTIALKDLSDMKTSYGFDSPAEEEAYSAALDLSQANGSGSGFVIERNGHRYIITNAHVVESTPKAEALVAYSINQTAYPVKVIGADTFYDLAVLEFATAPGAEVKNLQFRTTPVRVGETVFAIGNPLGELPYTVTQGIVGGLNRTMPDKLGKFGYIQSSAMISPGNSGGPLVDAEGLVVGVNTWGRTIVGPVPWGQLNFAQQAAVASRLIDELVAGGRLKRASIGVELVQLAPAQTTFAPVGPVLIAGLVAGTPASKAMAGSENQRVQAINGMRIRNIDEALAAFERVRPGETVKIDVANPATGAVKSYTFEPGELTDATLAGIATHLLSKRIGVTASPKGGRILVKAMSASPKQAKAVEYQLTRTANGTPKLAAAQASPSDTLTVVAIGVGGESDGNFYRTGTMADAGRAIKLFSMSGLLGFVSPGAAGKPVVRVFSLSGNDNVLRRTLLY